METKSLKVGDKVEWILSHGKQSDTISEVGVDESRGIPYVKLLNCNTVMYQHDIDRVEMTLNKNTTASKIRILDVEVVLSATRSRAGQYKITAERVV